VPPFRNADETGDPPERRDEQAGAYTAGVIWERAVSLGRLGALPREHRPAVRLSALCASVVNPGWSAAQRTLSTAIYCGICRVRQTNFDISHFPFTLR